MVNLLSYYLLLILFVSQTCFNVYGQSKSNAVDSLVKENSSHLLQLVGNWNIANRDQIKQYLSNPFTVNDSQKKAAILTLIDYATFLSNKHSRESFIIQDEIVFKLCTRTLENYYGTYLAEDAFEKLCDYSRFDHLAKYSADIKHALSNRKKIGGKPKEELLCLLNLSGQEKTTLLEINNLPEYVRVRLGDTISENDLIAKFLNEKQFYIKKQLVNELGTAATPKSIQVLIRTFNDTNYEIHCGGKTSITAFIIPKLGRLQPDNQLLTDDYEKIISTSQTIPPDKIKNYLYSVTDWMNKTYNVKPEKSESLPFIQTYGKCK